jgi:hypothetical protein
MEPWERSGTPRSDLADVHMPFVRGGFWCEYLRLGIKAGYSLPNIVSCTTKHFLFSS